MKWLLRNSTMACLALCSGVISPGAATTGEGGTSHVTPGANVTLVDVLPTTPGWFFKPMYLKYSGSVSASIPTAAGVVSNADATANTFALGGGYTFETTVLGGAHYTVAAFLPYTSSILQPTHRRPSAPSGATTVFPALAT